MKKSRDLVVDYLINEVWGPVIPPSEKDVQLPAPDKDVYRLDIGAKDKKIYDPKTGEFLVLGIEPAFLYGTGVLHAPEAQNLIVGDKQPAPSQDDEDAFIFAENDAAEIEVSGTGYGIDSDDGEGFALEQSQKRRPNALGLSCEPVMFEGDQIQVTFSGATYDKIQIQFGDEKPQSAWMRKPFAETTSLVWKESDYALNRLHSIDLGAECNELVSAKLRLRAKRNPVSQTHEGLIATFVVKNNAQTSSGKDIFQSTLKVEIVGSGFFQESKRNDQNADDEQKELNHLFRHTKNYATGHGTAVHWNESSQTKVVALETVSVPFFHQEVLDFDSLGQLSMKSLASSGLEDLKGLLEPIVDGYIKWIAQESAKSKKLNVDQEEVVENLREKASYLGERIKRGYDRLITDPVALKAFQLANHAMYQQQANGRKVLRRWERDPKLPFTLESVQPPKGSFGNWRPFQIAFLLSAIPGLVDPSDPSRDEVDLIFFPTGGGKTEAYLGVSAFTIIFRRLTSQSDSLRGVDVLMRYTLRLLTIQQFERSAGLICVLEQMRQTTNQELGTEPISIGVWLGSATTPNRKAEAIALLGKDLSNRKEDDPNPFILGRCPICAAQFGWDERKMWRGYEKLPRSGAAATLRFICSDSSCFFGNSRNPLPIWITDEDVYQQRPTFILGTVDKFAQMSWQPLAKRLFNLNGDAKRIGPPPALIIQDELHLISGPLGSVVGLFEPAIEELCTDRRDGKIIKPKIIASTATTRKYESQVKALYGREKVVLFPQAIDRANETYFSTVLRDKETGIPEKGTLYLGLNPGTYDSGQTSAAKVAAILRQAPNMNPDVNDLEMDHYRTSVWFFNSLRELGMTLTLMNSVVRDMIGGLRIARRLPTEKAQYPFRVLELTSRIESNKVASSLAALALNSWDQKSYDTCLASSIMEVGVDVPRLGLLTIMGQPKTTSQYIQVSGRVGRNRSAGPGLVVMLYNTGRARDRSVYERFNTFHESLYANVEPISVTPFAIEAMQKSLKSAVIALYRMQTSDTAKPNEVDWDVFESSVAILRKRIEFLGLQDQNKLDFDRQVGKLKKWWGNYLPSSWRYSYKEEKGIHEPESVPSLMRGRRETISAVLGDKSVQIMTSMRSVDGQTNLEITRPYAFEDGDA